MPTVLINVVNTDRLTFIYELPFENIYIYNSILCDMKYIIDIL